MNNVIHKKINIKLYIIVQISKKMHHYDLLVKINTTKFSYEHTYSCRKISTDLFLLICIYICVYV